MPALCWHPSFSIIVMIPQQYQPDFPFLFDRKAESHKGDYGHALLIAGSYGKMGAACLAASACLHSGVGLLTVHVPRRGVDILQVAVPEAMLSIDDDDCLFSSMPQHLDRYDAIAVGPGIGTDERTQQALFRLLQYCSTHPDKPLVLDADALNIIALHPEWMDMISGTVITPHAGEYQRLFGDMEPQDMCIMHNLVIVKKAHRTAVFAPQRQPLVSSCGNAGMATAGSGDVLTGVTLALMAQAVGYHRNGWLQDVDLQRLAFMAVLLHGDAGDRAASLKLPAAVVAGDIVANLLSRQ